MVKRTCTVVGVERSLRHVLHSLLAPGREFGETLTNGELWSTVQHDAGG